MKNSFLLNAYFLIFAPVLVMSSPFSFAKGQPAGKIVLAKGQVFVLNNKAQVVADPEGKRERTTKPGSPFYVGETIQTRSDSRVKIEFFEGGPEGKNEVVLGPNSSLVIQSAPPKGSKTSGTQVSLTNGQIRANIRKKYSGEGSDKFEVRTPNAVAGVRGTIFAVFFNAVAGTSDFATEAGSIIARSASSGGNPVRVDAGMFSSASDQGSVTPPRPLSANPRLREAVQSLGDQGGFSANSGESGALASFAEGSDGGAESGGEDSRQSFDGPAEAEASGEAGATTSADSAPLGREPQEDSRAPASGGRGGEAPVLMGDLGVVFSEEAAVFKPAVDGSMSGMMKPASDVPLDVSSALKSMNSVATSTQQANNQTTFGETVVTIVVK